MGCDSEGSEDAGGHPEGRIGVRQQGGRRCGEAPGGGEHGLYLVMVLNHSLLSSDLQGLANS